MPTANQDPHGQRLHCSISIAVQPGLNTSPGASSPLLCCCFVCCSGLGELEIEPGTSHMLTEKY